MTIDTEISKFKRILCSAVIDYRSVRDGIGKTFCWLKLLGKSLTKTEEAPIMTSNFGEVPEWPNGAVSKTVMGRKAHLEFKSLPLR